VKAPSPLLGFNNNVRHKGRVFHIQTEDSGVRHPHIITHLFADGGRILKTTKTSYAEHVGLERFAETVRAMMQDQHKAMFIALRDGQFDYLFEEGPSSFKTGPRPTFEAPPPPPSLAEAPPVSAPEPPPVALVPAPLSAEDEGGGWTSPPPPAPPASILVVSPAADPMPSAAFSASAVASSPGKPPPLPPRIALPRPAPPFAPTEPMQRAAVPPPPGAAALENSTADVAMASRRRGVSRPTLDVDPGAIHRAHSSSDSSIDLDLDALERAAAEAQTPFRQQIQDLPPPPATVLGSKRASTGGYSVRAPAPPGGARPAGLPEIPPIGAPSPGRYAPSRPASIFATTRPQEGASIFGEDLISEKSLDEVILSYLAEDLDGPGEKK